MSIAILHNLQRSQEQRLAPSVFAQAAATHIRSSLDPNSAPIQPHRSPMSGVRYKEIRRRRLRQIGQICLPFREEEETTASQPASSSYASWPSSFARIVCRSESRTSERRPARRALYRCRLEPTSFFSTAKAASDLTSRGRFGLHWLP